MIELWGLRCWSLALSAELFLLIQESDLDMVLVQFVFAPAIGIDCGFVEETGRAPFNFVDSIVYAMSSFEDTESSAVTHSSVLERYQDNWRNDGMNVALIRWH